MAIAQSNISARTVPCQLLDIDNGRKANLYQSKGAHGHRKALHASKQGNITSFFETEVCRPIATKKPLIWFHHSSCKSSDIH
ncbi:hypothetical protein EmuJ_000746500 [Echinococcus multilocularis]|uniref:Uncharacterized protein n=1 Tax=Echinococcus multilocularis TaxID=6211 RepID=A0A068YC83_ECHMU|nr:hypothetical protein EmuJ_000746500 [Echinococcus multilocularis]